MEGKKKESLKVRQPFIEGMEGETMGLRNGMPIEASVDT